MSDHIEMVPSITAEIYDIFGTYVTVSKIKGGIELDCGSSCTITLSKLQRVAAVFETDKIDVNNEMIQGGYCETCSYEETRITLQILK